VATVLLIRHGRTTANSSGVLAGWTPGVALDDTGREQAERLAARVNSLPLVRVVASPLQRCQETAAALTADRDLGIDSDDDLGECHYGAWTGRSLSELADDPLWRVVQDHPSGATFPPDDTYAHESLADTQARAVAAVRRIDHEVEAQHGERAVWAAVSHGDVIKAILADALGLHLDGFQRIMVNPASVSVVRYTPRRPFVLRSNDCGEALGDVVPPQHEQAPGDAAPGGATGADPAAGSED
jgi:probable phosphomutase (TIGR03848 family)